MAGLLGRHRDSQAGHATALAVLRDVYGPDHIMAMPLTNMGVVHLTLGELDRAAEAQERAATLFAAGYGPHHPHTALARRRLGVVRLAQGCTDDAEALLRAALDDTIAGLGPGAPGRRGHPGRAGRLPTGALARQVDPDLPGSTRSSGR